MKKYLIYILLFPSILFASEGKRISGSNKYVKDSIDIGNNIIVSKSNSAFSSVDIHSKELTSPSIDVAQSLYGKIAGLNVYQGSGMSAKNSGVLSLHGRTPLLIVDGAPRGLDDLVVADIESISVLKDATAFALYGVRGANGIVVVTTKRGSKSNLKVGCNYQFGLSTQFRAPEFADSYTYANYLNRALTTDGLPEKYNSSEIEAFQSNRYPFHYPNVDWWKAVHNELGMNHRLVLTFDGGGDKSRYYSVIDYMYDRSFLKNNQSESRYNSKPTDTRLNLRTNLDIKLTNTTNMQVGISAKLKEMNLSNFGDLYSVLYRIPSAAFPIRYTNGVYGGSGIYEKNNPVALIMDTGNTSELRTSVMSNVLLNQKLDSFVKGLSTSVFASFDYAGSMNDQTYKTYKYIEPNPVILPDGTMVARPIEYGEDSKTISHASAFVDLYIRSNLQGKINYSLSNNSMHKLNTSLIYEHNAFIAKTRNRSIKRQSYMAVGDYTLNGKYSLSAAANYSGSAYLPPNNKFNLFYGVNVSWRLSDEKFMKGLKTLNNLRIFASHGLSGWDGNLSHELHYASYSDSNAGSYFFTNNVSQQGGYGEDMLPVENLTVEKIKKTTVGFEASSFDNRLELYAEAFYDHRKDILITGSTSVSGIIGVEVGDENSGIQDFWGVDFRVAWNDHKKDFGYGLYVNGAYMSSELINSNQPYQPYSYLYHKGNMVGQMYGLEAVGFFQSQQDINNSAVHTFDKVKPGDIKYKDQNGDNMIDNNDMVKMFGSNIPMFYYGFGFNISYKNIELLADFQGMTGVTINLLNSPLYKPLINNGNISKTFLSKETVWTPENIESATMPRLTTEINNNNYRNNSLWYRDGSFLKLRNLRLSYRIENKRLRLPDMLIYVQGTNLFSIDNIKIIDPEQLGATYPSVRSYWLGMKFNF